MALWAMVCIPLCPPAVEILRPYEVHRGDKGVGWSVFQGETPDSFQVEILGVLPGATPGGDFILAKLTGQNLEKTGVIAGMSGSPVFVGGKLLGAVAYGWAFSKEAIAGITPIHAMFEIQTRPGGSNDPFVAPEERWMKLWGASSLETLELVSLHAPSNLPPGLAPIQTPIILGGFGASSQALAQKCLTGAGFIPVLGSTGGLSSGTGQALVPGSSLSIDLVRGDAQVSGIGTVTWVEEDQVYALGHPMFGNGSVFLPMSSSSIITVLPSVYQSFKMGATGDVLGAVTHDYQPGILGTLGVQAPVIPVSITLSTPMGSRELSFEVAHSERLTPLLIGMVAGNAVDSYDRGSGPATVSLRMQANLKGGRSLERDNVLAGMFPPQEVSGEVARSLSLLYGNPWEPLMLQELSLEIQVTEGIRASSLERVEVTPGTVRPGEVITVHAYLEDYRGESHRETGTLKVPRTAKSGTYQVLVCAGRDARRAQGERSPGTQQPHNVDQLIHLLQEEPPFDALLFELSRKSSHPVVQGFELPDLPASWERVLSSSQSSGRNQEARGRVVDTSIRRIGKLAKGCQTVSIHVKGD